ncbi:sugar isomerase (SIS) [Kribbella flavida DSM 17836]|uniref:Sugar isomerase (SIS) n=1 Tax=Kribbella flavida (strain DSM 17836 / JCM 10339 / NBRC 14399) TaxID=479435 RepID=D2PXE8_KRIFD|nr:SIS domain-containing protein [Kribbella flavida]ADB29796.1 sugar isomerase (SIS) [Kribbella flavida DSM 17836]
MMAKFGTLSGHLDDLREGLRSLEAQGDLVERWGQQLAGVLADGGRLLAAGNGGSAAEAQHLTAELVGRFEMERRPLAALALHAETSSLTAIGNDYGFAEAFARQVEAHGRPGDVLMLLSTSGRSTNLLTAAERARRCGLRVWAMTGPAPNPLADAADEVLAVQSEASTAVQEAQLVAVHALCATVERCLPSDARSKTEEVTV